MNNLGHNSNIQAYDPHRQEVANLVQAASNNAFDYASKEGNRMARSYLHGLRKVKAAIEETRKKEKAESLEYGRRVDEQAKVLVKDLEALMVPHEKELERLEKLEAERVGLHQQNILKVQQAGDYVDRNWATAPVDGMEAKLLELQQLEPAAFQEFAGDAATARDLAVVRLTKGLELRKEKDANEAELARLREAQRVRDEQQAEEARQREAREQAERDCLKGEQDERDRVTRQEREAREEETRQLNSRLAEEQRKREAAEAEAKAARDRELKALEDAAEADRRAEQAAAQQERDRDRLAREQQEAEDREKQRLADEAKAKQEKEYIAARRSESLDEATSDLVNNNIVKSAETANLVIASIVQGRIRHIHFVPAWSEEADQ